MPLHEYRCASGHTSEVLQATPTASVDCRECGLDAQRALSVFATTRLAGWGNDFEMPDSVRSLHEEIVEGKEELRAIQHEYESNGFKL